MVRRYSTSGGLKAVLPLISATPPMKVCDATKLRFLPNTSRLPGRAVVWTPFGIGKVRGSKTVSDTAFSTKNQSSPRIGSHGTLARSIGRSPFSVFWSSEEHTDELQSLMRISNVV